MAMISSDTRADVFDASDVELMSLHGNSDDDNSKKKSIVRDLEDPIFKFALNNIFSNSKEFKWTVEVHVVMKKTDIKFNKN